MSGSASQPAPSSTAAPEPAGRLICSGCGASPAPGEAYPFRCPRAGEGDVDHVLVRRLDKGVVTTFPTGNAAGTEPFAHYRHLLHSYYRAISGGLSDADFVALVERLDAAVAAVDGHGFSATPFRRDDYLSDSLRFEASGGVWVKDETHNVSGSHKGRHLMGVLIHLEVAELIGLAERARRPKLAIASCGNAALAAAIVARAGAWQLSVFVPPDANASVVARLTDLGADVVTCPRQPGVPGDPTYARLLAEVGAGALPFTCQGNMNGLAIEGGETLAYEIVSELTANGLTLDHLVVQVGGGALASACIQGFAEAVQLGALAQAPRAHTVQTTGGHPLQRAHTLVAQLLPSKPNADNIDRALSEAASQRSVYMWPWESEPQSIATGILDDETYDWLAVVGGMLRTGGCSLVVSEERLAEAHALGKSAGYSADPTGTAGLAGLLNLIKDGTVQPNERVAVLFTGIERAERAERVGRVGRVERR